MIVGITGHRPNKLFNEYEYDGPCTKYILEQLLIEIKRLGVKKAISGMAIGADTIWAELILSQNIPLIAAIPFKGQESRWPKAAQERYFKMLSNPLVTQQIVNSGYSNKAMQIRNEYIVDNCDVLIAVWNGIKEGGTWNTVNYAREKNKNIVYIHPEAWKKSTKPQSLF